VPSVPYLRLFEISIGNNSSPHARHHQNIITSHTTFLFTQFTQTITSTLPTLILWPNPIPPSLHSNHPAALFVYCIRAYRIRTPSVPAALPIVPYAYPLICSSHQHYSYKSMLKFLPDPHIARIMRFVAYGINSNSNGHPPSSLPHVIHLVSLLDSQIRGCRASGGVLRFESRTRHVMIVYIP
jgi:hypothetical protein